MKVKLQVATADDVAELVSLQNAVAKHLTSQHGKGNWSHCVTANGICFEMRRATMYVARVRKRLVATLTLSTRKPWAIDKTYFSASKRPLYLTSMAVIPTRQGKGIGRLCIDQARDIARRWPGDAIRLDAYNAEAGGGEFYRKCGFREVGRALYRNCPLIYFEMLL
jgi:GNAT superfamily N-acetyltransferase